MSGDAAIDIVGAGPAGLAAAITLARAGRPVIVHETQAVVGYRFKRDLQGLENWTMLAARSLLEGGDFDLRWRQALEPMMATAEVNCSFTDCWATAATVGSCVTGKTTPMHARCCTATTGRRASSACSCRWRAGASGANAGTRAAIMLIAAASGAGMAGNCTRDVRDNDRLEPVR